MKSLNRPMFRRGGKASSRNNGIVSGFENGGRVGYQPGGAVGYLEEMGLFEEPQRQKGLSTADYLRIASAGAEIMGAQPTGRSGFIGALQAASPALSGLGQDLASSAAAKEADYQAKLAANKKLMAGAALSDFESERKFEQEKDLIAIQQAGDLDLFNLQDASETDRLQMKIDGDIELAKLDKKDFESINEEIEKQSKIILDPNSTPTQRQEARNAIGIATAKYTSPIVSKLGEIEILSINKRAETIATSEGLTPNTSEHAVRSKEIAEAIILERGFSGIGLDLGYLGMGTYAKGGRVGLQEGGNPMMAQQTQPQPRPNSVGLTFEELRARLPQEVTDGVVRLLATSEAALLDFANLETQEDIAQFNQKYNTDLQLPAQVA